VTYLVDANILSEAVRPQPNPRVVDWLHRNERAAVVDPIILGEIRFGILLLPSGQRKNRLERWFTEGVEKIHCITWNASNGLRWAKLVSDLRAAGTAMPIKDSLIATTALLHQLTVATHNTRDFLKAGVKVVDPFID
jgi:predicted nucleic acid-binding protein